MSVHIEAKQGEIAESILLPGDPLRAKYIAETFLEDVTCYNNVRGMLGFTGTYKGKRVSVQSYVKNLIQRCYDVYVTLYCNDSLYGFYEPFNIPRI